ncbi:bifunctional proline dehydrogenase/L-glutamate gamma-semialdehyde dehydrogenase PutA [Tranquillimonas alkanivorans]|uniref:Bifunctional protein PutA n=1 Tax=Tranquillimonas alkanivorans TaxID=441119 RepID=A0A1I5QXF5_9RHOB|nr:bifunctional proline dehydrogenase/L-glutamate gamma-semialdehyde dehydrogenase PutA [Tranquillimonas alkanivorans]SFP50496.1 L-proline dehydrogenase /delta-1-pyrroline-5-carboxylate dehydrogenase [Tranquillimonas alkanivorans]
MPRDTVTPPLARLSVDTYPDQDAILRDLVAEADLAPDARARTTARGAELVRRIRASARPGLMEMFLAEYGLSTEEGIALMCLAEALLRVPDSETIDALIEDKIAPSDWGKHLGHSSSSLVNASTWALMLTGRVLEDEKPGVVGHLRGAVRRLGEPVIRTAVGRAMREMGRQFVLGETMSAAMERGRKMEAKGYTYSYDMLGEAARTDRDAQRYHKAYADAIDTMSKAATHGDIAKNPGISVKFSALHPRYEVAQGDRIMEELVPRVRTLARQAAKLGIGLNVDAEEADRLTLSLAVIEEVLSDTELHGWDGFGVVVQAYGPRAGATLDWLYALAEKLDRRIMVRLVKGAYWDTEIKHAQTLGMGSFPVFTSKAATDVSYIANARKLLGMTDRIYPQFATHNAHTVAAILEMAEDRSVFEFQRLHGMGERLHDIVLAEEKTRCRIYAPVGAHRDLLAYLVRRLLENGANSSFVNQIVDEEVPPETVAADPFDMVGRAPQIPPGTDLFLPERPNSRGWDLANATHLAEIEAARLPFRDTRFTAAPLLAGEPAAREPQPLPNPADPGDTVGEVRWSTPADVDTALAAAQPWDAAPEERARVLNGVADLYEEHHGEIFAIVAREAGKSLPDAVGELREAVDFLRYYAARIAELDAPPLGRVTCISPWNFPLAIFTGQIAAALAAGNAVLAKPAEQTPLIADLAVRLMHEAGVPRTAIQLLPGGGEIGAALTSDARVDGVTFTGSTETALKIRKAMAENLAPGAPLTAETGGLNAMIVDSTALAEQAVADVLTSAFQSAGQRCSALRCLYVQADVAPMFKEMLFGAMEELRLGDPWSLATDVGPLIDGEAHAAIKGYVDKARSEGRVLKELNATAGGHFLGPVVIGVSGIEAIEKEVFGPVLHLATFEADELDAVIDAVNARGFGLTFGLHTRIDSRVQHVVERVHAGNLYVNRNQIGAIVGSQPFGGEGLSGTGPKAGGPMYVRKMTRAEGAEKSQSQQLQVQPSGGPRDLPGPTGESNRYSTFPRAPFVCLGPDARAQAKAVEALGGRAVVAEDMAPDELTKRDGIAGALWWGDAATARDYAQALARREGAILPLLTGQPRPCDVLLERHVCVDTTASGGNAQLLAEAASA